MSKICVKILYFILSTFKNSILLNNDVMFLRKTDYFLFRPSYLVFYLFVVFIKVFNLKVVDPK